ncbi:MAG: PAS domain-containing protein [Actinobacteria bacterium]|nr:PAS domain-containing protein [Actinomycetota bacterium]
MSEAILKAVLESAGTGILVVDFQSRIMMANALFQEMWRIPSRLMETSDDAVLLDFVCDQLEEPQAFPERARELYHSSEKSHDLIGFKDGRVFERFSAPWSSTVRSGGGCGLFSTSAIACAWKEQ